MQGESSRREIGDLQRQNQELRQSSEALHQERTTELEALSAKVTTDKHQATRQSYSFTCIIVIFVYNYRHNNIIMQSCFNSNAPVITKCGSLYDNKITVIDIIIIVMIVVAIIIATFPFSQHSYLAQI